MSINVVVGKFGVGKSVSENSVSENLLSEKSPDTVLTEGFLALPRVGEPQLDLPLQRLGQVEVAQVVHGCVHHLLVVALGAGSRRHDVFYLIKNCIR